MFGRTPKVPVIALGTRLRCALSKREFVVTSYSLYQGEDHPPTIELTAVSEGN